MSGRYDRQIPLIGESGQRKLSASTVGIAGCGGLGNIVVTDLASAGIGRMILADPDVPDVSNLNRQFVFREGDAEMKANILSLWARQLNPDTEAIPYCGALDRENLPSVFGKCDVLIDCLDTLKGRLALNQYAVSSGKTLVHGGVSGYSGQVTVVVPGKTPCLECIYGDAKENGMPSPSISPAVSAVGSLEALQAVQILTGTGEPLIGRMAILDMEKNVFETVPILPRDGCTVCGRP